MKTILATTALAATLIGAGIIGASATVVVRDGGLLDVQADSFGIDHARQMGPTTSPRMSDGTGYFGRGTATGGPAGGLPNKN